MKNFLETGKNTKCPETGENEKYLETGKKSPEKRENTDNKCQDIGKGKVH